MINSLRPEFVPWFILCDSIGAIRIAYVVLQSFRVPLAYLFLFCGDAFYSIVIFILNSLIFAWFPVLHYMMQFIFVSALSSSNYCGNVHAAVFGFDLKYICIYTCKHPLQFALEKTKSKECACYLKWTVMKCPLAVSAWRGIFNSPGPAPQHFVTCMEMRDCSFHCFCYSSADEQEHSEGVIFKFQILPYSLFVWGS